MIVVRHPYDPEQELYGVVDRDFNEGDRWISATLKDTPYTTQMRAPGYEPSEVRLATQADLDAAPDFVLGF